MYLARARGPGVVGRARTHSAARAVFFDTRKIDCMTDQRQDISMAKRKTRYVIMHMCSPYNVSSVQGAQYHALMVMQPAPCAGDLSWLRRRSLKHGHGAPCGGEVRRLVVGRREPPARRRPRSPARRSSRRAARRAVASSSPHGSAVAPRLRAARPAAGAAG